MIDFTNVHHIFLFIFFFFTVILVCLLIVIDYFLLLLLFLDLLLLSTIFIFIFYSALFDNDAGYSFAVLVLGVAAADTAVGLGLFIVYYKATANTSLKEYKW